MLDMIDDVKDPVEVRGILIKLHTRLLEMSAIEYNRYKAIYTEFRTKYAHLFTTATGSPLTDLQE